jgi:hypothetical protein
MVFHGVIIALYEFGRLLRLTEAAGAGDPGGLTTVPNNR